MADSDSLPAQRRASRLGRTFVSLRLGPYRWLLSSTLIGVFGYQMQSIALGWLVYLLTGSALALGLVTFTQSIAQAVTSPLAGVIADRVERRTYIMAVRSVTVIVGGLVTALIWTHQIQYFELVVAAAILGVAYGLNGPARQALMAELVGPVLLVNAVSLMSAGMNTARIVGPAVAGYLIGVVNISGVYAILTLIYLIVIVAMIPVPVLPRPPVPAEGRNVRREMLEGIKYGYSEPAVFGLLLFITLPLFFAMPYQSLLPIFADQVWHSGAQGFGILAAMPGIGGVVGALVVASLSSSFKRGRMMIFCAVGYGVCLILFALSPTIAIAAGMLLVSGGMSVAYSALASSMIQTIIPNQMRGRVMSFVQMSFGIGGLSTLPASALATIIGAPTTIALCGVGVIVISIWIFRFRPILQTL